MLSAIAIINLHDDLTRAWHLEAEIAESDDPGEAGASRSAAGPNPVRVWLTSIARHHRANFDLWHIEDEARAPNASDAILAEVKRRIDRTNQFRNDQAEELDRALLDWLAPQSLPAAQSPLHSESPGLMIDRLSILALKIFHTREEADRTGSPNGHLERNRKRLAILEEQRADLAACLDSLWRETIAGTRRFKIYRQLKMYNDPSLNPAIYGNGSRDDRR
jgi:hypothetical protein